MAVSVNALLPNTPPTTAIQDPAARTWANSVANILSASQSSAYAVQQLSKAAEALSGGGAVPPSIAQWLFSSELYWKLTQAIEKVDVAAKQAIIAEALERASAIAQEQVDRADAIFAESQARGVAIQAEVDARTNAINAERDARVAALAAEALARGTAITNEATVRQSEDEALAQQITTLTGVVDNNVAAIQDTLTVLANEDAALAERVSIVAATSDAIRAATAAMVLNETRARADSDTAFAQQITTLSAAVDDNAANIQTESATRATQYDALAEQITLVSAGVGEQFDFKQIWYFDDGVDGWSGNGAPTVSAGWLRPANHATDPYVDSPAALAVTATQHNQVRLRIRKYGTPTWAGKLWWKRTTDSTWDAARSIVLDEPAYDASGIGLISVSVSWTDTIDQVRLALSTAQDATNYFTIDWFAVGRPSPGASTAALLNEATARATADTALTNQLNSLSSTVTGNYGTLNAAITTEATTRANADSALSSQINSVSAAASGKSKVFVQSATPAATQPNDLWINTGEGNKTYRWDGTAWVAVDDARIAQNAAAVVTETNARVDGDDALADQITTLTATVGTNDSTVRGLITSEATTRASEDEALARTVDLVSATAESIRVATAAMAVSETVARANQDEAFVSRFEVLEATVGDNTAAITAESTARADADGALTTQINTVSSVANGRNRTFRQSTAPTGATNGDLWYDTANNNSVKRWDGSSWVTTDNARIASNEAAIVSEATTRANNDTSIVNAVNTMWAITGATNALSQSGNNIVTNWTTAQANYWSNLNAEVFTSGGQTIRAALQQEATTRANADGSLGAQWTLKTDINGYIAGFGFASTANNATPTSEFIIRADKFAVVMPGYGEHVPFAIGPSGAEFTGLTNWASVSGDGKPENGATVGAPAGTLVAGVPAANVATAVTDFNASNNRNNAAITAPTILTDGTAVDHVAQTDGSVDISFEWGWSGNEGDIDGFLVYARPSTSSSAYTLGTTPAEETVYTVPANKRAFVLFGVAADKYYTFGVQAYRAVDKAINAAGVIKSTLVKATGSGENPYLPSSTVAFTGDVTGTINGTDAATLVSNASIALTNANAAQGDADAANAALADISDDNKLTPAEKQSVRKEWDAIYAERAGIRAQADSFGITIEKTNYDNKFQALGTYLNGGTAYTVGATPPSWITDANLSTTTTIVGSTFRANWSNLYADRQALLNKISSEAGKRADWATITGLEKPENGATVGADFGRFNVTSTVLNEQFASGFTGWVNRSGDGEVAAYNNPANPLGSTDGKYVYFGNISGNDQVWAVRTAQLFPYDPNKLYRMRVRCRQTGGSGELYVGFEGIAADGTTYVTWDGQNLFGGQHYFVASGKKLPAVDYTDPNTWTELVGYAKGSAAQSDLGEFPSYSNPCRLHANVKYFRPVVIANYNHQPGSFDLDYVIIEEGTVDPGNLNGQISAGNITTYIANAAIGNAQIGTAAIGDAQIRDAAITSAKIGYAQVDTLRIKGNAVTIPLSASGANLGSIAPNATPVTKLQITGSYSETTPTLFIIGVLAANPNSNGRVQVQIVMDSTLIFDQFAAIGGGMEDTFTFFHNYPVPAGTHTFYLKVGQNWGGGPWTIASAAFTALGTVR